MTDFNFDMLRDIFSRGLTEGLGTRDSTCVEGAIALAMGEGLTDQPSCVAPADRDWAIVINDGPWSSPQARAEALLPIALAQIDTAGADRQAWIEAVVLGTTRCVLPIVLQSVGVEADACEKATNLATAYAATKHARAAVDAIPDDTIFASVYRVLGALDAAYQVISPRSFERARAADCAAQAVAAAAEAVDDHEADYILRTACEVALDAYRAEGRTP